MEEYSLKTYTVDTAQHVTVPISSFPSSQHKFCKLREQETATD